MTSPVLPTLTKKQRETLATCIENAKRTIVSIEEYEAASPYHREKYRTGFDASGAPIIRRQSTMVDARVGNSLAALGLVRLFGRHRNIAFALPTSRGCDAAEVSR